MSDPTSPQKPSVGRIVHYTSHGTPVREDGTQAFPCTCRAAMVTAVGRKKKGVQHVDLFVMNPTGVFLNQDVPFGEWDEGGKWHWPERV